MGRLLGHYQRNLRLISIAVGMTLAVVFNVDSVALSKGGSSCETANLYRLI